MPALTAASAAALDVALMSRGGFSLATLVELAGLALAQVVFATFPPAANSRVLVVCGSGNQGLDGLAAARWLATLKYAPTVVLPRPPPADSRPVEAALSAALRTQLAAAAPSAERVVARHERQRRSEARTRTRLRRRLVTWRRGPICL